MDLQSQATLRKRAHRAREREADPVGYRARAAAAARAYRARKKAIASPGQPPCMDDVVRAVVLPLLGPEARVQAAERRSKAAEEKYLQRRVEEDVLGEAASDIGYMLTEFRENDDQFGHLWSPQDRLEYLTAVVDRTEWLLSRGGLPPMLWGLTAAGVERLRERDSRPSGLWGSAPPAP